MPARPALSVVAAWAADQVGDTGRYVDTVAPLASHPDVQDAVAGRVTDIALAAWLTGPGRRAGLVRRLWATSIAAVRSTADGAGLRTGPVGPFVRRRRTWITWVLVAASLVVYLLWPHPTGWVAVAIALCVLFLLAVVEFLAARPGTGGREPVAPPARPEAVTRQKGPLPWGRRSCSSRPRSPRAPSPSPGTVHWPPTPGRSRRSGPPPGNGRSRPSRPATASS